jgi:hypothetical protein
METLSKILLFGLALSLILSGCSKKTSGAGETSRQQNAAAAALPFNVTIVETNLTRAKALSRQARELFKAKDYEKLEQLAAQYQNSKECFPSGEWYLANVIGGIGISGANDEQWQAQFTALREWIRIRPKSIFPRLALADALISYAWQARGSDTADKVTEDGGKKFVERATQAHRVLKDAKSLEEHSPEWWPLMMRCGLALGMDKRTEDSLFRQALKEYPDYTFFYCGRAYYLLPRWYGAKGEWEADLKKSADLLGGDEGDLLYARVIWHLNDVHENIFRENALSWERVDRGFEVMEKRFPDSLSPKSMRAYMAALGADHPTARKYFDRLDGKVDLAIWNEETFRSLAETVYTH